jgi:hypothetical protein
VDDPSRLLPAQVGEKSRKSPPADRLRRKRLKRTSPPTGQLRRKSLKQTRRSPCQLRKSRKPKSTLVSLLRRKSLKPPRRLTGPNKARASGRVTSGQTDRFAGHPASPACLSLRKTTSPARVTDDGPGVDSRVTAAECAAPLMSTFCPRIHR